MPRTFWLLSLFKIEKPFCVFKSYLTKINVLSRREEFFFLDFHQTPNEGRHQQMDFHGRDNQGAFLSYFYHAACCNDKNTLVALGEGQRSLSTLFSHFYCNQIKSSNASAKRAGVLSGLFSNLSFNVFTLMYWNYISRCQKGKYFQGSV